MNVIMGDRTFYCRYTPEETVGKILPVFEELLDFSCAPDSFLGEVPGYKLFKNPNWKGMILGGEHFGCIRLYPPDMLPEKGEQFTPESKKWDTLRPTWIAMIEYGIRELYHIPVMHHDARDTAREYGAAGSIPHSLSMNLVSGDFPEFSYGEEAISVSAGGEWAAWTDTDRVTVMGGEPELMDRIAELSGGWDYLTESANKVARKRHEENPKQAIPSRQMFKAVGWDVPEFLRVE